MRSSSSPDDDPPRADFTNKEETLALSKTLGGIATGVDKPTEGPEEGDRSGNKEKEAGNTKGHKTEGTEHLEKVHANERLVRSVLSTHIAVPAPESVFSRVLRAVLNGNTEELSEVIKHEHLKGAKVAMSADSRKRTALHLAVATRNINTVRVLMRWRLQLNQSLEDELDSLNQRRDMFIQKVVSASACDGWASTAKSADCILQLGRFENWLTEEKRRILRAMELQCEEYWRKVIMARDDQGRTPLHWAASIGGNDGELLHALLTTGRADLSARDVGFVSDASLFTALKIKLDRARSKKGGPRETIANLKGVARHHAESKDTTVPAVIFRVDEEFHRSTGKIRRRRGRRRKACDSEEKRDASNDIDALRRKQLARDSDPVQDPDGLTASTAKVTWFCEALAKAVEKLAGGRRGDAEAFLLSVFEDFDRNGDGTMTMRQFGNALHEVRVNVPEQTLLEVGRYFQAPAPRDRHNQRKIHHARPVSTPGAKGDAIESAPFDISYVALMDIVFGRENVREPLSRQLASHDWKVRDDSPGEREHKVGDGQRRLVTTAADHVDAENDGGGGVTDDGNDDDGRCFVTVDQIRARRVAVVEAVDGLGRSPLFLAAATGNVHAATTLIQHGAESAFTVEGTSLTPYSVAPSLAMKKVLASDARQSLYRAVAERARGQYLSDTRPRWTKNRNDKRMHQLEVFEVGAAKVTEVSYDVTRRMESWVADVADQELQSVRFRETRADHKSSLHLAATAGLPTAVKNLLNRGLGVSQDGKRCGTVGGGGSESNLQQPTPNTPWRLSNERLENTRLNPAHRAFDHTIISRSVPAAVADKADGNGWSALHSCCAEASPQHFSCALALLGSQADPNARTNTGKTPLHVAANAFGSADCREGCDIIPLLVSHGADPEVNDSEGLRPVHVAAKNGQHVALLALLTAGANPWTVTPRKWNPLHYAVAGGFAETSRLLAYWDSDSGVFGRQKNSAGVTAAELGRENKMGVPSTSIWEEAAMGKAEQVARAVLESARSPRDSTDSPWACPGVNRRTPGLGFTPLHACLAGLAAVWTGVDVSPPCTPPRPNEQANVKQRPSVYAYLARSYRKLRHNEGDISTQRDACGSPSLTEKYPGGSDRRSDYIKVCRTLLSAAADVEALDARGRTPLALAASAGSLEVVEMLLNAGADPHARDLDGNTPLHFAYAYANVNVAAALGREGADLEACNRYEKTPQDVAGLCADLAQGESGVTDQATR